MKIEVDRVLSVKVDDTIRQNDRKERTYVVHTTSLMTLEQIHEVMDKAVGREKCQEVGCAD